MKLSTIIRAMVVLLVLVLLLLLLLIRLLFLSCVSFAFWWLGL